jgi:hypothetical protein
MQDGRREAEWRVLRVRYLTRGGTGINTAVTAAASSVAVAFTKAEQDAVYGVVATPDWGTTTYVTSKATTGFTLNFGTAAPGGGGVVDWTVFRAE